MSQLDKLIKKVCPNGVEFYQLRDIVEFRNGKGHEKHIVNQGKYIVVNSKFIATNGEVKKYSNEQISALYNNDILMVMSDLPNGRALAKCFLVNENDKYTLNQRVCALKIKNMKKINAKFLYYYLTRNKQLLKYDNGVDQTNLKKDNILKIEVPVPPLEIQNKVVQILDNYTLFSIEISSKLSAELKARQKQYEYYRDKLVNSKKNIVLSEILKIKNGKNYKSFKAGNIPVYGSGGIIAYTSKYAYNKPSVLIPRKGSINKLYYVEEPFWNVDTIFYTEINEKIALPKYIFYCLENEHLEKLNIAGGVPSLTQSILNKVKLYIPNIKKQREIVEKLNKLNSLINNISERLSVETETRQKQYEYYRDKLLTFDNLKINRYNKVIKRKRRD